MSTHHRIGRSHTPPDRTPGASGAVPASGRPWAWRGIDLITAAMMAVAFGVLFWGFDTLVYPAVSAATAAFPPLGALSLGVWLIPAVVGGLVVRRPGAALFTELVAANVELFLGNTWGVAVLLSGLLQGMGVELVLAAGGWRRFGRSTAVLGGIVAAVLEVVAYEWWAYTPDYSPAWKAAYLGCGLLSGAVVAGLGGWALVRFLARAGALDAFPAGQEARESAAAR
jgi:energy-coupling factor transport system permease protein